MTQQTEQLPLALLLDLSGDKGASKEWAAREMPGLQIQSITKAELKWGSKREALALARRWKPDVFAVFTPNLATQSARAAMTLFGVLAGARGVLFGDGNGRAIRRSRVRALLIEAPRFALESLAGYLILVPLSWLLTEALILALAFRATARASRSWRTADQRAAALYVKAAPAGHSPAAAAGGMATHVTGFTTGALDLGHDLEMLASDDSPATDSRLRVTVINTSSLLAPTRALFELWNNLAFTARALRGARTLASNREISLGAQASPPAPGPRDAKEAGGDACAPRVRDFIYQRYNRFNWTGVALSLATGLPLALEFNGSEVWLSENWDPVGLLWLLRRFERLNLNAADQIFVVSEVERRNLLAAGIEADRIVVNPNGVDVDRFAPGCGGREVRAALGVSDKIVVGFVGTFGPWHGAPVLAETVALVSESARCHFLFVGDGEQRSTVERIIDSASKNAVVTFAGRIPHSQVPSYLDACDVFAAPNVRSGDGSEFFGSPTKLFEYMAMARPVIGSRLGQIADVIEDGSNGVLVEPGNAEALARAIEKLAADKELRAKLGYAARRTVIERYTWRHNAARVFDTMLNHGSKEESPSAGAVKPAG
ncbi:MAG: glycosyltransferase [Acidobacteriota bacterium]